MGVVRAVAGGGGQSECPKAMDRAATKMDTSHFQHEIWPYALPILHIRVHAQRPGIIVSICVEDIPFSTFVLELH